jgi:hypothetical protein
MRPIVALFYLLPACLVLSAATAREWKDATGKHSVEAEMVKTDVVLRLSNGEFHTLNFEGLWVEDQRFVLEKMRRILGAEKAGVAGDKPAQPGEAPGKTSAAVDSLEKLVDELWTVVGEDEPNEVKVSAIVAAIRKSDPSFASLRERLEINDFDFIEIARQRNELQLVSEIGADVPWMTEKLVGLDERFERDAKLSEVGLSFRDPTDQLRAHRAVTRLLSQIAAKNQNVAAIFTARIDRLKSHPEPDVREKAALRLSGATAMAEKVVPVLFEAMKKDVSPQVRDAAMIALGGFGKQAKSILPELAKRYEAASEKEKGRILSRPNNEQWLYLLTIADVDAESSQLKKIVREGLESFRREGRARTTSEWQETCRILNYVKEDGAWATTSIISNAQLAADQDNKGAFKAFSEVLLTIAPGEPKVLALYEKLAKRSPEWCRVHCDTVAKQLRLQQQNAAAAN